MIPIILDTCAIVSLKNFSKLIEKIETPLYITPSVLEELKTFETKIPDHVLARLRVKSPCRENVRVSGALLWEMVCEFRKRADNSIKYACGIVREAYSQTPQPRVKGAPDGCVELINRLRDGMRHHTREGYIDSGVDVDSLLLSLELKGKICTCDAGLLFWAGRLGVEVLSPDLLQYAK